MLALGATGLMAAIDPAGLVMEVRQEQAQRAGLNARGRDGARDRSTKRVRVLDISCRYQGDGKPEPATVRWFFIGKDQRDGKFDYYALGATEVSIPRRQSLRLRVVSDPLRLGDAEKQALQTSVLVSANSAPHGWIVMVVQEGQIVKQTASLPGLLEWMSRNPPPRPKPGR